MDQKDEFDQRYGLNPRDENYHEERSYYEWIETLELDEVDCELNRLDEVVAVLKKTT